ncbi:MAG: GerMN domain-containing protein [Bacillota bacterium]
MRRSHAVATALSLLVAVVLLTGCSLLPFGKTRPPGDDRAVPPTPTQSSPSQDTQPVAGLVTIMVHLTKATDSATGRTYALPRQVPKSEATIRGAMEELLKGPTEEERAAGYTSWFSEKTAGMVKGVSLHGGRAIVDFADFSRIIPNASTSSGSQQLLAELTRTICQFSVVTEVEYRFDGSNEAFMEWLQMAPGTVSAELYR